MSSGSAEAASQHAVQLADGLARWLEQRTQHPVQRLETHISRLLLTATHAYKLKKPVSLGFLDFSQLAARRHFCEEELRLNRRLAPSIYLDVMAITGDWLSPQLRSLPSADGGLFDPAHDPQEAPNVDDSEVLDYVLRMKRFAPGSLLDEQLRTGQLTRHVVAMLGERLAVFHERAPRATPSGEYGSPAKIEGTIGAVMATLKRLAAKDARCSVLEASLLQQTQRLRPVWQSRLSEGFVREGHGDLHLGNTVMLPDGPTAFDCIEFDPGLRWIDVMADLGFLSMDLAARGRPDLAAALLDGYLQVSGDQAGLAVLRHYEVYRAMVRSMVGLLTPQESPPADYLSWSLAHVQGQDIASPRLLITHGVSGSGKSTWSQALVDETGAVRIRSDVERKRLFGLGLRDDSRAAGLDIYTREASKQTFEALADRAQRALTAGYPVIVDAAFLRKSQRAQFQALAKVLGVPFHILHCAAPHDELAVRLQNRSRQGVDPSEATIDVLNSQQQYEEPLTQAEETRVIPHGAAPDRATVAALAAAWLH